MLIQSSLQLKAEKQHQLFIHGIQTPLNRIHIMKYFETYGELKYVHISKGKSYGFASFKDETVYQRVLSDGKQVGDDSVHYIGNIPIKCKKSINKKVSILWILWISEIRNTFLLLKGHIMIFDPI